MNEDRILALLEQRLGADDPALAATMAVLNQQFPDEAGTESSNGPGNGPGNGVNGPDNGARRRRWLIAATVFAIIAVVGLFLTAVLNTTPRSTDTDPAPTRGLAPAVSAHPRRRRSPPAAPRPRGPDMPTTSDRLDAARARDPSGSTARPAGARLRSAGRPTRPSSGSTTVP
ncbi:DUF3040 domain-containing protein [Streptomyces sp. TRM68367]|nr:DUF3040 domain-containing protein [Streptomyces sp. TRM68367]